MKRPLVGLCIGLVACGGPSSSTPVLLRVPPGATVRTVADSLAAHSLIGSRGWFRLRARWARVDRSLKPGVYQFAPGTSTGAILSRLAKGESMAYKLTLPEGGTLFDLARSVEEKMGIAADSFLRAARDTVLLARNKIDGPSVEGWLLPQTFDFDAFARPEEILQRFIDARLSSWDSTWDQRSRAIGFDHRREVLTLASIVEAEALHKEELATIAAVYRNRLKIGMPLQADPTIQYGYLIRDGIRKPRLYYVDYEFNSPWNSYLFQGLPPGPIGNPTSAAIEAALSPAPDRYLYFVAGADGHHTFSVSYAEHQRAIRRIRRPN